MANNSQSHSTTTPAREETSFTSKEKVSPVEIEDAVSDTEKGALQQPAGDYAGAVTKFDPREIALVRKLDWRLMPTLWAMYFL